jgi:hypothetical protein
VPVRHDQDAVNLFDVADDPDHGLRVDVDFDDLAGAQVRDEQQSTTGVEAGVIEPRTVAGQRELAGRPQRQRHRRRGPVPEERQRRPGRDDREYDRGDDQQSPTRSRPGWFLLRHGLVHGRVAFPAAGSDCDDVDGQCDDGNEGAHLSVACQVGRRAEIGLTSQDHGGQDWGDPIVGREARQAVVVELGHVGRHPPQEHGRAGQHRDHDGLLPRGLSRDATLLIAGQALRAAGYGFTAVVLGALLAARGYGTLQAGAVLTALIAGTAVGSLLVGAIADQLGRRRCYVAFFLLVAAAGGLVAIGVPLWLLLVVALTGTLSTDVVDNGPATTLEQVMLAGEDAGTVAVYGRYNAVGAVAGALGALGAALPGVSVGNASSGAGVHAWLFLVLVPVGLAGAVLASRLSSAVEGGAASVGPAVARSSARLGPSRSTVRRLAALFAVDAGGGGLVTTAFLAYFFAEQFHVSVTALGWLFFMITLI